MNDINVALITSDRTHVTWDLRTTNGGFFSFLEQWTGDNSFVHINVDLDGDGVSDLLISPGDDRATVYRTLQPLNLVHLESVPVAGSHSGGLTYLSDRLVFSVPIEHFGGGNQVAVSITGAWARDSPSCSIYSCDWYTWFRLPGLNQWATVTIR